MRKSIGRLLAVAVVLLGSGVSPGQEPKPANIQSNVGDAARQDQVRSLAQSALMQRAGCEESTSVKLRVDQGHRWRPPFGIDRVGAPVVVSVEVTGAQALSRQYHVVAYQRGKKPERSSLSLARNPNFRSADETPTAMSPFFGSVSVGFIPEEVAVLAQCPPNGEIEELLRKQIDWPSIEGDIAVRPNRRINPVDLGTVLVPHDWLILSGQRTALIHAAAISHTRSIPGARMRAWFDGGKPVEARMPLPEKRRVTEAIEVPVPSSGDRTTLHVSLHDGDKELWRKELQAMIVAQPPPWPDFGAVETRLRYDAPISMHDPGTGAVLPSIDYDTAWDSRLNDVVVFLPNGERFVFWRGSSYIPFWAGAYNTGVCYQWAENLSTLVRHPDGSADLPEPLFDRELRYGRVRIMESTRSRVHVRWTYQLTDVHYNVWGDQATEDYYFYPDGFGTRVLNVASTPGTPYQLTEFIVLTPRAAYPLDVLPSHMADVLFLDGEKQSIKFPFPRDNVPAGEAAELVGNPRKLPMVYRFFAHKDDPSAAIYFSPRDPTTPAAYWPFYDQGQLVTPTYWGSHWPLSRGKWTHWTIDDGIHAGPAHNSVAGWSAMPEPLTRSVYTMPDALGRAKTMTVQRWVALIAKTQAADELLLDWAKSFSDPPSFELTGGAVDFPSYSPERRSIRLIVESPSLEIKLKPPYRTINPVFELGQAPKGLASVTLNEKPLPAEDYAWDGGTLWVKATVDADGATIGVRFH